MKIYLAGPIYGKTDEECNDWRNAATKLLEKAGHEMLNPMERDYRGVEGDNSKIIVEEDKRDIDNSDMLLVLADDPSWGTAMEIMYGYEHEKRMIIISTHSSPWIQYHATMLVKDLNEALQYIIETYPHGEAG